ncbi:remorin 1.4-like isoform X1 [Primulina tabacum]|uniref:remorin 1.4-like isoform X1 n=1 Tax=Primulina tabacum TaxID=48773 RepID=UPI003F5A177C
MGSEEETKKVDEGKALVSLLKEEDLESPLKPPPIAQEEAAEDGDEKISRNCEGMESTLARVETEKRLALIKAWEENKKTKVDNKAHKKLAAIDAWENTKRAYIDAQLKQIEENFEKKKAKYGEKMKNKMAISHRTAEEMRATVAADCEHAVFTVEEAAATFRATGRVPKKLFACFGC